jgi:hypothetical protein
MKTILNLFAIAMISTFGVLAGIWNVQSTSAVFGYQKADMLEILFAFTCLTIGVGIIFGVQMYTESQRIKQQIIKIITYDGNTIDLIEAVTGGKR